MQFDISKKIILLTLAGSHSYGMNTPTSDVDVRGICVTPFDLRLSLYSNFEQYEGVWPKKLEASLDSFNTERYYKACNWEHPEDVVIYDVAKSIKLIGECNPNMLELLFCEKEDYLYTSEVGERLINERNNFLSLKAKHTYTGYAKAQLGKIERHRAYLLGEIPKNPTRTEYGLPEHESLIPQAERNLIDEEIKNKIRSWSSDNIELAPAERITLQENLRSFMAAALQVSEEKLDSSLEDAAAKSLGFDQDVRQILKRERAFRNALKQYKSYQKWSTERNKKRKILEEKHGFDTKHASHLIRLARTGVEVLEKGCLFVKRDDAEELLSIRRGEIPFEKIKEDASNLFEKMNELYLSNPLGLPHFADKDYLDKLSREIILMNLH